MMTDYSKAIEEIRRNNEKLEESQQKLEKEKEKRQQEEKRQEKMDLIKDKVISYLLETIKEKQSSGRKVRAITLFESKNPFSQRVQFFYEGFRQGEKSLFFEDLFGASASKIDQIYGAFGLGDSNRETEAAEGFFRVRLEVGSIKKSLYDCLEDDLASEMINMYFLWSEIRLIFIVNY